LIEQSAAGIKFKAIGTKSKGRRKKTVVRLIIITNIVAVVTLSLLNTLKNFYCSSVSLFAVFSDR
jgi:hypothetical protein